MTSADLIALRHQLGLTQTEMADGLGMGLRAYHDIETGKSKLRPVHALAAERVAMALAIQRNDPMLAPMNVRKEAVALARLLIGD